MTDRYLPPRLLRRSDRLDTFECRSVGQTRWLRDHARQADATGTTRVLVVTRTDSDDVIARTTELSTEIGCRGLLVHAETPEARDFCLHLVPEFESSPTDDLHLLLVMKDIRRTLGAREP